MKRIFIFLLLFFYQIPSHSAEKFNIEIFEFSTLCKEAETKFNLKDVYCRFSDAHSDSNKSHIILIGNCDQEQVQEALLGEIKAAKDKIFDHEFYNVSLISLGRFYTDCMWVLEFGSDYVIYIKPDYASNYQEAKFLSNFNLIKMPLISSTSMVLTSGPLNDVFDFYTNLSAGSSNENSSLLYQDSIRKARQAVQEEKQDIEKVTPVLMNPTSEAITTFIKIEVGRQDLDISLPRLTATTGSIHAVTAIALITPHGIPAFQEAFFLNIQSSSYFLQSLGKFSCDTFNYFFHTNDSFVYLCKSLDLKNIHFTQIEFSASSQFSYSKTRSADNIYSGYAHENDSIFLIDHHSLWAANSSRDSYSYKGIIAPHPHDLDTPYLIEEGDWENIINTRFMTINGKFYQITPCNDKEYGIYTLQKTDGRYRRIPTNVTSTEYIHTLIADLENPAKILAYQTGTLSQLTWCFCDESFEQMVSELSSKINSTLQEFNKPSWHFSKIPFSKIEGEIEFDEVFLKKQDKEIKISCDTSGEIDFTLLENVKFIPLAKPEIKTTKGPEDYSIDYAVFHSSKTNNFPLPTVMIIEGGPHVFIEHKYHAEKINFFNQHGYHVVIPQGLFRQGYSPEYAINTKGRFGELDMELLRCVLRDLRVQNITSQPVYIIGGSYGGYSCARLGFDSDLVKAAFVENAFLDLTSSLNIQYFWTKNGEDEASKERRLRALSPALEAPLPRVPVFMVGVQNDVRCPITQSRAFANRLGEKALPLIYLEHPSGGHDSTFSHLELIKDFFEGQYGDGFHHDRPEGYQVMIDSNQFFNK